MDQWSFRKKCVALAFVLASVVVLLLVLILAAQSNNNNRQEAAAKLQRDQAEAAALLEKEKAAAVANAAVEREKKQAAAKAAAPTVEVRTEDLNRLQIADQKMKNTGVGVVHDMDVRCTFYWKNGNEAFTGDQTIGPNYPYMPLPNGETSIIVYDVTAFQNIGGPFKGLKDDINGKATKCRVTRASVYHENTQSLPIRASFNDAVGDEGKHEVTAQVVNTIANAPISVPKISVLCIQIGQKKAKQYYTEEVIDPADRKIVEKLILHVPYTTVSAITIPPRSQITAQVVLEDPNDWINRFDHDRPYKVGVDFGEYQVSISYHNVCWIK